MFPIFFFKKLQYEIHIKFCCVHLQIVALSFILKIRFDLDFDCPRSHSYDEMKPKRMIIHRG